MTGEVSFYTLALCFVNIKVNFIKLIMIKRKLNYEAKLHSITSEMFEGTLH